jgi:hypothetical protein
MTTLPRFFGGVPMTEGDIRRLRLWIKREGWTRKKTLNHVFLYGFNSMPTNLLAPEVPQEALNEGSSKCACVVCGYTTSVTNVCRQCGGMPLTEESIIPVLCHKHAKNKNDLPVIHRKKVNGRWVWRMHSSVSMVCVASVQQRLEEETGESRETLVGALKYQKELERRKKGRR